MRIENSFQVPVPREQAWELLTDVSRVADCLPGAKLTEDAGDGSYRGELGVKLGPVSMKFLGKMRFTELDAEAGHAVAEASAREGRNRGSADAVIDFSLTAQEDGTRVDIVTELALAGQAAQYGRGAGVLKKISEFMIARFAQCLRKRVAESEAGAP
jgi:carbon monoxide dehydrogenase subunit G